MLKKLRFPALALAAAMAIAVPTASMAADRNDHRGRDFNRHDNDRHEVYVRHDRDDRGWRDRDHGGRFGFGIGVYSAPAANGYYDQFGVWHAYAFYDQYGVYHAY